MLDLLAGSTGLEPATSGLTVQCANQAAPRARAEPNVRIASLAQIRPADPKRRPGGGLGLVVRSPRTATRTSAHGHTHATSQPVSLERGRPDRLLLRATPRDGSRRKRRAAPRRLPTMTPSYQPTPQQELCLQAALLSGDAALGAWRKTGAAFHLDQLDDSCQTLLPLVYGN